MGGHGLGSPTRGTAEACLCVQDRFGALPTSQQIRKPRPCICVGAFCLTKAMRVPQSYPIYPSSWTILDLKEEAESSLSDCVWPSHKGNGGRSVRTRMRHSSLSEVVWQVMGRCYFALGRGMGIGGRARSVTDRGRVAAKARSDTESTGVNGEQEGKEARDCSEPHGPQHTPVLQEG